MDLGTEIINYILQFNSLAARNENYCDYKVLNISSAYIRLCVVADGSGTYKSAQI